VDWIEMAQEFLNTVMNIRVSFISWKFVNLLNSLGSEPFLLAPG
jgi:hypothetical protein